MDHEGMIKKYTSGQNVTVSEEKDHHFLRIDKSFVMIEKTYHKGKVLFKKIGPTDPGNGPVDSSTVDFGPHQHDFFELIYVLDGELTQHIENTTYRYKKGDACLLNRNVRHSEGTNNNTVIYLNITSNYIREVFSVSKDTMNSEDSANNKSEIYNFVISNLEKEARYERDYLDFSATLSSAAAPHLQEPKVVRLLDTIAEELIYQQPGYSLMLKVLLLRFFRCLEDPTQFHLSHIRLDSSSEDFLFARVNNLLEERHGRITRNEISKVLNYNGDYLNQIVKKHSGKSIHQLGQDYSLKEAKRLLRETDLSIHDILQTLNITNRSFFYKLFGKQTGMSPKEYRQSASPKA